MGEGNYASERTEGRVSKPVDQSLPESERAAIVALRIRSEQAGNRSLALVCTYALHGTTDLVIDYRAMCRAAIVMGN